MTGAVEVYQKPFNPPTVLSEDLHTRLLRFGTMAGPSKSPKGRVMWSDLCFQRYLWDRAGRDITVVQGERTVAWTLWQWEQRNKNCSNNPHSQLLRGVFFFNASFYLLQTLNLKSVLGRYWEAAKFGSSWTGECWSPPGTYQIPDVLESMCKIWFWLRCTSSGGSLRTWWDWGCETQPWLLAPFPLGALIAP